MLLVLHRVVTFFFFFFFTYKIFFKKNIFLFTDSWEWFLFKI